MKNCKIFEDFQGSWLHTQNRRRFLVFEVVLGMCVFPKKINYPFGEVTGFSEEMGQCSLDLKQKTNILPTKFNELVFG